MDAQEIPILTQVYATQKGKDAPQDGVSLEEVMAIVEEYKSELESELKQSLIETLKPQLTAEISADITQRVRQSLGDEVAEQLKTELVSNFRREIAEELKATNHTVSALQNAFTNLPDIDEEVLLGQVEQKNQSFLERAQQLLTETQTSLILASTERMNLEIAGKIAGMQELAVTQAKAQVMLQLQGLEKSFKEELITLAATLQQEATATLKTQMADESDAMAQSTIEQHKQAMAQSLTEHFQAQSEQSKEAHAQQMAALDAAFQAQHSQSLDALQQHTQAISEELLQVVTLHAQKLNQESEAKLAEAQARFDGLMASQSQQIQAESQRSLETLQQTLVADVEGVAQQLSTQLQQLREQAQDHAEASRQDLLAQVQGYTNAIQSDVEKLQTQVQAQLSLQTNWLEQASAEIQSTVRDELGSLIEEKRAQFKQALDADAPELLQLLDEKVKLMVAAALPAFEEALTQKIRGSLMRSLASTRLVLADD